MASSFSPNQFIPKIKNESLDELEKDKKNSATPMFHKVNQYLIIGLFALVPIFFVPGLYVPLGFDKVLLTATLCSIVIVLLSLSALKKKELTTILPLSLLLYWSFVIIAFVSSVFSGDVTDAIRGSVMEVQTVGFMALIGILMTVTLIFQRNKNMTLFSLTGFSLAALILTLYNFSRFIIGSDFWSFGDFTSLNLSPIGYLNDLAIFSGLVIIFSLITLVQLPLRSVLQALMVAVIVMSLFILAVVNFFNIWVLVGMFGLLMLVYLLTRDTLFSISANSISRVKNKLLISVTALVCAVSGVFIFAGDFASNLTSKITTIDYVQVKPSHQASIDIIKDVYQNDLLLGVGANRFADAWRLHKYPSIAESVFWNTDFNTGSGYILTLFATVGLLGGLSIVIFHLWFLYLGYRMLLRTNQQDSYWYYLGSVSFAVAVFVWSISYIYEPGPAILLIGALFTGLTFVAASSLLSNLNRRIPLVTSRRRGFFLMSLVVIIIPVTTLSLFSIIKQYNAQTSFNQARQNTNEEEFIKIAEESFVAFPDDRFMSALAQIHLAKLDSILRNPDPKPDDEKLFLAEVEQAKIYIDTAIEQDPTNPYNHALLAELYKNLAIAGVGQAMEKAEESVAKAKLLDPLNPSYSLLLAHMFANLGDLDTARKELDTALMIKPNFTEALFLSAQLEIKDGNIDAAIADAQSIITFEPRNSTRYLQLGMLQAANGDHEEAIISYQSAIQLDSQYANARYLLALSLIELDQKEAALEQLRIVELTNPNNEDLIATITQIEKGEDVDNAELGYEVPIETDSPDNEFNDTLTTNGELDTNLVSPVNTTPETGE